MAMNLKALAKSRNLTVGQVELLRDLRGMTAENVRSAPEAAIRRSLRRRDYADLPRARHAYRVEQSRDDHGVAPCQAMTGALRELDSLRLRSRAGQVAGMRVGGGVAAGALLAPAPVGGLQGGHWKALGPADVGGRTRCIVVDPARPNTLWLASVAGGIWRSSNGGASWSPVDDFMANLSVTSIVLDPADGRRMYAATGEGFGNVDALRGGGIFTSDDGQSWRQLPSTAGADWATINRLAISSDGTVLLAATGGALMRSSDPGRTNWLTVLPAAIADLKFHPTDPLRAVAGAMASGRCWYTLDGGVSWKEASRQGPGRRVEVCYARADPNVVYASVDNVGGEVWRSANGGRSFTKRPAKNPDGQPAKYLGDQGWYANVIWADDPTDVDLVIVGGLDLWRSRDGGASFVDISTWWDSQSAHADQHAIVSHSAYDGAGNRKVYFANDGGLYRADDVTTVGNDAQPPRLSGWSALNNGYAVTQFYGAAGHSPSGVIVGGTQDNGTFAYHPNGGAAQWRKIFGGDGGYCASDPANGQVFYGEYVYLGIHRNLDGGLSDDTTGDRYIDGQFWNPALGRWDWKPEPFRIPDAFNQSCLFIAPFTIDPNQPNRILAGGRSLWRTDDADAPNTPTSGPRWTRIKPPSNDNISAIAITPGDPNRVWVGHVDGEIWRSPNAAAGQPGWSMISGQPSSSGLPRRFCTQLLVSPHDPNVVLASFGGFLTGNVWMTGDSGQSWSNLGAGLPAAPVRAVAIHPQRPNWFYLGSEVGMFASEDAGSSWSATNEGPANVSVDDLIWMGTTLICVTHGRGMFELDIP